MDVVPGTVVSWNQDTAPLRCTTADPENSGGAPSPAQAPSRQPGLQKLGPQGRPAPGELPSSPWPVVIRGTSWSWHQAGKCGRKEKGRKTEGWARRGRAPTELEKRDLIWQ